MLNACVGAHPSLPFAQEHCDALSVLCGLFILGTGCLSFCPWDRLCVWGDWAALGCSGCVSDTSYPGGRPPAPCSIFSCCCVRISLPVLSAFTSVPVAAVTVAWSQLWELGVPWLAFRVYPYPEQSHPAPTVPVLLPLGWNNSPTAADGYFGLQPLCLPLTFHSCWSTSNHSLWSWAVGI